MSIPQVSVIVAVYDCRDTVERAVRSALDQSIDADRVEVIAVDDGSTDGGGELLDEMAGREPRLRVVHQANSGGPGAPRNAGIDRATGEFVYILDADDYLGREALARMCAMAEENGTDIVIGKYAGVGRKVPRWMFRRNFPRISVADRDPWVYGSLSSLKMFRRSMIERHRIRFAEGHLSGEDQIFTAHAYLHADGISIVGDYDCYYLVSRPDGTSAVQLGGAPTTTYLARIGEVLEMVERHVEPGELRDRMLRRHFEMEILGWRLGPRYIREDETQRRDAFEAARRLVSGWMTPGVLAGLPFPHRFRVHCLRHDLRPAMEEFMRFQYGGQPPPLVVEAPRVFAAYPGFREPATGIPDDVYEITGEVPFERRLTALEWTAGRLVIGGSARLPGIDQDRQWIELVLRRRAGSGEEHRLPVEPATGQGAFRAEVDPAGAADGGPLSYGLWDVSVAARVDGFEAVGRLGGDRADGLVPPQPWTAAKTYTRPRFTGWVGNLTLEIGMPDQTAGPVLRVTDVAWTGRARLRVVCSVSRDLVPEADGAIGFWLKLRGTEVVRHAETAVERRAERLDLTAEFDLAGCPPGRWDLTGEIGIGDTVIRERLTLPEDSTMPAQHAATAPLALRRGRPYRTEKGNLSVHITEHNAIRRLRQAVRRG